MRKFKFIEHTADVGIIAYGKNLPELFINAAYGMFSIITDVRKITDNRVQITDVKVRANNLEELLIVWLNELLYQYNTKRVLFAQFKIKKITGKILAAQIRGEKIDSSKHPINAEIKAATYHQLKIQKNIGKNRTVRWQAEVIFDV